MFVDSIKIRIKAGSGGDGSRSFRREKFIPDGGPDGGDGGKGGDVYFAIDKDKNTLSNFRYNRLYAAEDGKNGEGKQKTGKSGSDIIINVPKGTVIFDENKNVIADIIEDNKKYLILKGGKGGLGNVHFKNSVRQAPNFAIGGEKTEEKTIILELKIIADVGLIGFPNAGKSTFLASATKARPKIANYPFTTIIPNLGVVEDKYNRQYIIADIPGIIEGASNGVGLGNEFLKHIQRCRVLLHIVDSIGLEQDPVERFRIINDELKKFSKETANKKQIMCINKIDTPNENNIARLKEEAKKQNMEVFEISAVTGKGVEDLITHLADVLDKIPKDYNIYDKQDENYNGNEKNGKSGNIRIYNLDDENSNDNDNGNGKYNNTNKNENRLSNKDFDIYITTEKNEKIYNVSGKSVEKIMNRINMADNESMHYFHKKLEEIGIEKELKEMGIKKGDTVNILGWYFEWYE